MNQENKQNTETTNINIDTTSTIDRESSIKLLSPKTGVDPWLINPQNIKLMYTLTGVQAVEITES